MIFNLNLARSLHPLQVGDEFQEFDKKSVSDYNCDI